MSITVTLTPPVSRSRYKSPYPYFGGKSTVAADIWARFGHDVTNFVDPFFGSNAVLLARPGWNNTDGHFETVNDASAFIANFWRAIQSDPEETAFYADWPSNENDLHARHIWLVNRKDSLRELVEGNPEYFDAKIAGWWVWGMANWLGSGWCEGVGPWQSIDGKFVKSTLGDSGGGVKRQIVHIGSRGGVNRQIVHLGNNGTGINRHSVHTGSTSACDVPESGLCGIYSWFEALSNRLRRVRVACGDWQRVLSRTPTTAIGTTAILLDPPYAGDAGRDKRLYEQEDLDVAYAVRDWAIEHGSDPLLRIAVCGYESPNYTFPDGWESYEWKANGGFGNQQGKRGKENASRERIWFSPHCLTPKSNGWEPLTLFDM